MKKIIVVLICFLAIQASAQITIKPGVRAGANFSRLINTDLDAKTDFYVGGFVAIKLAKFYTLQPELTYSRQGGKGQFYFDDIDFGNGDPAFAQSADVDYQIQYLSLGVMNKFKIIGGFHGVIGPNIDFKVGDNLKGFEEDVVGLDLGLTLGFGYTLPIGLTFEARAKIGFLDIFGDDMYYDDTNYYNNRYGGDPVTNSTLQLGVAYQF